MRCATATLSRISLPRAACRHYTLASTISPAWCRVSARYSVACRLARCYRALRVSLSIPRSASLDPLECATLPLLCTRSAFTTDRELEEMQVQMLESWVPGVLTGSRWAKAGHRKGHADPGVSSLQNQETVEAIPGHGRLVLAVYREGERN